MMRKFLALALFLVSTVALAEGTAPTLEVQNNRFTVDGQPRFLVLVSYFDAMRASPERCESDFQYLHKNGIDGIRVFPNWWDFRAKIAFAPDTLMDGHADLRPDRLAALKQVLDCAARHGLIVDMSFAYETVEGLSDLRREQVGTGQGALPVNQVHVDEYERGLVAVTKALMDYRNLFFDIQNEYNGRITHLSDDEVRRFGAAIRKTDAKRLVTASLANEIGAEEVASRSNETGVDIVGWHESRNPWQYDAMDMLVGQARAVTTKPIYLGEPALLRDELTAREFIVAVTKAKAGGAAAWTFHTQHCFDLSQKSLADSLTEGEKEFIRTFKKAVDATSWGIAKPAKAGE
jgi:hypothetical protein